MGNVLNTLSSATKEDAKLYNCIKELYDQGVPFEELKALIPDMKRTREQLRIKRMLENNNEMLVSMITKEMSFLLDAKERQQDEEHRPLAAVGRLVAGRDRLHRILFLLEEEEVSETPCD